MMERIVTNKNTTIEYLNTLIDEENVSSVL